MTTAADVRPLRRSDDKQSPESDASHGRVNEIQRGRMVGAMIEACVELGAANVTVASVVERSGVSRRTFYELFSSCDDCWLAAFEEALGCLSTEMVEAYREEARWQDRVRAALIAMLSFFEQEPFMGRFVILEAPAGGSRTLRCRKQALARALAAIDEGRGAGGGRVVDPPKLMAEGIVGGVLAVIQARMLEPDGSSLLELAGPLMSMIVLPYLGASAARSELARPTPPPSGIRSAEGGNPLRGVDMRLTYRTVRVLGAVAGKPGSSNREVGLAAGVTDQGQISKLLTRLAKLGLVSNDGAGRARGAPNAWTLTARGAEVHRMTGAASPAGS